MSRVRSARLHVRARFQQVSARLVEASVAGHRRRLGWLSVQSSLLGGGTTVGAQPRS